MSDKLRDYMVKLAYDLDALTEFLDDPLAAMAAAKLAEEDQAIMLSGDQNRMFAAVGIVKRPEEKKAEAETGTPPAPAAQQPAEGQSAAVTYVTPTVVGGLVKAHEASPGSATGMMAAVVNPVTIPVQAGTPYATWPSATWCGGGAAPYAQQMWAGYGDPSAGQAWQQAYQQAYEQALSSLLAPLGQAAGALSPAPQVAPPVPAASPAPAPAPAAPAPATPTPAAPAPAAPAPAAAVETEAASDATAGTAEKADDDAAPTKKPRDSKSKPAG